MSFFDRQIPILGLECQEKLKNAKVFVGGVGGLGCTVCEILVRCGVGQLYISDTDLVDETNLHRQFLYTQNDIGKPKIDVAKAKLESIGTNCNIKTFGIVDSKFELPTVDIVVDCFDNKDSKYILSMLAFKKDIYFVHAGVFGYYGQLTTLKDKQLKDVLFFSTQQNYIIPQTVSFVGSLQAMETLKLICSITPNLLNKILSVDLLNYKLDTITLHS